MQEDPTIEAESKATAENRNYVAQSSKRTAVMEQLTEGPASAEEIASEQSMSVASAQSVSEELHDRGLVELLITDEVHAYGLTAEGAKVLFSLKRMES